MENTQVKVFALSTCIHCNRVKQLLQRHNIAFEWTDIDLLPEEEQEEFFSQIGPHNPKKCFPVVIIGNTGILGAQRERIMQELGIADES